MLRAVLSAFTFLTCALLSHGQPSVSAPPSGPILEMVTESWRPWITEAGTNEAGGIFGEINRELCRRAGIRYVVRFLPWKRCLNMMESGQADVLLMLERESERERYMLYSEPVLEDANLVFFRVGAARQEWESWEDLQGFVIGMTNGYTFGDEFEAAKKRYALRFDLATTDEQTLLKLVGGRFNVAIVNRTVANGFFKVHPGLVQKVKVSKKPASSALYYIAFSRKSPRQYLMPKLNAAIRTMKADGTIDRIVFQGLGNPATK